MTESAKTVQRPSLQPATAIGAVSLIVANLSAQLEFYQNFLGLRLHWQRDGQAGLGSGGADWLLLQERPGAVRVQPTTGLYHLAILLPNQRELAKAMGRLFDKKYGHHPTDHVMTKTTYLRDPEGQEIELYAESPEDGSWTFANGGYAATWADGRPSDGREPLDLDALFSHLQPGDRFDEALPIQTKIGHVHLYVRHLQEAVDFYAGLVGFDLMGQTPAFRMAFVSAGGYHHHIGLNTWMGEGAPPAPPGSRGLRYFSLRLANNDELAVVNARLAAAQIPYADEAEGRIWYDPSKNGVLFTI